MQDNEKNIWGVPYATEVSWEAFLHDIWDPTSEEVFQPKKFIGIGYGINLYAIGKKAGWL
ncbi:hypothetical protein [Leptospira sp. GIMC2001]|uniref:hypothetical protein n=1 Tax=Leptospira sp. GIMC2001 TaxID=1513297 RepID=UPI00234BCA92|nr:hypothetical protein [Leptospira sp. GIMC2001]WCL48915.1 hypothetical protein O4O04_16700 [Leptospira sp. GIMC2001]